VDGIRAADYVSQQLPSLEATDEMKVITFNAPAEYKTPSTAEMFTRQGTNGFHGDMWELFDDKSLQARWIFLPSKVLSHGHTFGASVGGPIKKDKLFFYFGFEEYRFANFTLGSASTSLYSLPTAKMQQGDFSELLDPTFVNKYNRGVSVTVKDPLTGLPFTGNVIPANRISSVSQSLIKSIWSAPTGPGIVNNSFVNALHPYERDKEDVRVDYNISSRHTMFVRFGNTGLHGNLATIGWSPENNFNRLQKFPGKTAGFVDTFIFNSHMTNEFRFGFSRTQLDLVSPYDTQDVLSSAGMQNATGIIGLPQLAFVNFTSLSAVVPSGLMDQVKGATDNFSIHTGRHSL
jgi:hypothetical protein